MRATLGLRPKVVAIKELRYLENIRTANVNAFVEL